MVADGCRRQALALEIFLPGGHVAFDAGGNPVVAVAVLEMLEKAIQVEGDLARHRLRANTLDHHLPIKVYPRTERQKASEKSCYFRWQSCKVARLLESAIPVHTNTITVIATS